MGFLNGEIGKKQFVSNFYRYLCLAIDFYQIFTPLGREIAALSCNILIFNDVNFEEVK